MIPKCPHAYTEREENYHLDMCRLHPEKLYGVEEKDCEWCLYCPDKEWQEWKHSLHPAPEPTGVRPIYGSIERYEVDVKTGTISYRVIQTNADRIRSMTDEELAEFMRPWDSGCPRWKENPLPCSDWDNCGECWLKWLKEEVSG